MINRFHRALFLLGWLALSSAALAAEAISPAEPHDPWRLKHEVQIGDALTSLTLLAGFTGFLLTVVQDRRKKNREDARSGALRLMLKILRENHGPMRIEDLKRAFESSGGKSLRKAYCGEDFKFTSNNSFEGAVYRLHWEGKIDFVSGDEVMFRVHERLNQSRPGMTISPSPDLIVSVFQKAFADPKIAIWELEPLAASAFVYDPQAASVFLTQSLNSSDLELQRRASFLAGKFPPAQK